MSQPTFFEPYKGSKIGIIYRGKGHNNREIKDGNNDDNNIIIYIKIWMRKRCKLGLPLTASAHLNFQKMRQFVAL